MPSIGKTILALVFITAVAALPTPQIAGEGAASDSIFTDFDNGVGYGVENAEDNLAGLVTSLKGSGAGTGAAPAPAPGPAPPRRQLDKISNGFQTLSNALGTGASTTALTGALDNIDGESTSGAANLGAEVGSLEESSLEGVGNAVPNHVPRL